MLLYRTISKNEVQKEKKTLPNPRPSRALCLYKQQIGISLYSSLVIS